MNFKINNMLFYTIVLIGAITLMDIDEHSVFTLHSKYSCRWPKGYAGQMATCKSLSGYGQFRIMIDPCNEKVLSSFTCPTHKHERTWNNTPKTGTFDILNIFEVRHLKICCQEQIKGWRLCKSPSLQLIYRIFKTVCDSSVFKILGCEPIREYEYGLSKLRNKLQRVQGIGIRPESPLEVFTVNREAFKICCKLSISSEYWEICHSLSAYKLFLALSANSDPDYLRSLACITGVQRKQYNCRNKIDIKTKNHVLPTGYTDFFFPKLSGNKFLFKDWSVLHRKIEKKFYSVKDKKDNFHIKPSAPTPLEKLSIESGPPSPSSDKTLSMAKQIYQERLESLKTGRIVIEYARKKEFMDINLFDYIQSLFSKKSDQDNSNYQYEQIASETNLNLGNKTLPKNCFYMCYRVINYVKKIPLKNEYCQRYVKIQMDLLGEIKEKLRNQTLVIKMVFSPSERGFTNAFLVDVLPDTSSYTFIPLGIIFLFVCQYSIYEAVFDWRKAKREFENTSRRSKRGKKKKRKKRKKKKKSKAASYWSRICTCVRSGRTFNAKAYNQTRTQLNKRLIRKKNQFGPHTSSEQ